jgi:hypothetical protein
MFFQRRRLQVLLSLLVIVVALLYLGGQLLGEAPDLEPRRQDSQLSEAFFLLRTSYVHKLEETPLLEGAVAGLLEEVARRQQVAALVSTAIGGRRSKLVARGIVPGAGRQPG